VRLQSAARERNAADRWPHVDCLVIMRKEMPVPVADQIAGLGRKRAATWRAVGDEGDAAVGCLPRSSYVCTPPRLPR
jgi:hypothetical protein